MNPVIDKYSHCQECGMLLSHPAEFHPYEFCILKKAGQNPTELYKRIVKHAQDSGTFDISTNTSVTEPSVNMVTEDELEHIVRHVSEGGNE